MTSWDEIDLNDMVVWYEWKIIHGQTESWALKFRLRIHMVDQRNVG